MAKRNPELNWFINNFYFFLFCVKTRYFRFIFFPIKIKQCFIPFTTQQNNCGRTKQSFCSNDFLRIENSVDRYVSLSFFFCALFLGRQTVEIVNELLLSFRRAVFFCFCVVVSNAMATLINKKKKECKRNNRKVHFL